MKLNIYNCINNHHVIYQKSLCFKVFLMCEMLIYLANIYNKLNSFNLIYTYPINQIKCYIEFISLIKSNFNISYKNSLMLSRKGEKNEKIF